MSENKQPRKQAVFIDRDSTINEPVYYDDLGIIDSPFKPEQLKMLPESGKAVKILNDLGLMTVLVTNQPAIAKGKMTVKDLDAIHEKMKKELAKDHAKLDAIYYCPHSAHGILPEYTKECSCRKPKTGMFTHAAKEHGIDLKKSFMIGDSWRDIKAGTDAGCTTIMVGHIGSCDYCRLLEEKDAKPEYMVKDLKDAALLIKKLEAERRVAGGRSAEHNTRRTCAPDIGAP